MWSLVIERTSIRSPTRECVGSAMGEVWRLDSFGLWRETSVPNGCLGEIIHLLNKVVVSPCSGTSPTVKPFRIPGSQPLNQRSPIGFTAPGKMEGS